MGDPRSDGGCSVLEFRVWEGEAKDRPTDPDTCRAFIPIQAATAFAEGQSMQPDDVIVVCVEDSKGRVTRWEVAAELRHTAWMLHEAGEVRP